MHRSYTPAEKRQRALLVLRGTRQAAADAVDPRLEQRIESLDAAAAERAARELGAMTQPTGPADRQANRPRGGDGQYTREQRPAAKKARQDAEQRLRRTEQAARRLGL
jgi:hypothetical protein